MSEKRANILFAIADDASHFSAYGHTFLDTPNFDRVAKEGVLFNNMFTTNPKCAPSRASILTGKHTWQLKEACTHWCVFPGADELDVYPDIMEKSGYAVGMTGKGWAPGDFKRHGRKCNPAGTEWNQIRLTPPPNTLIGPIDYAKNFSAFLDDISDNQPFCFWYGGYEPHRKYIDGEGITYGKKLEDVTEIPPYWPDSDIIKSDMLDYANEIEWFDQQLGFMLDELKERGELENTLVIVTSDNGAPFPRLKGNMYDDDFRLPCAAMWPGKITPERVVDDLASFIDFTPTYYELAGIDIPPELPGKSLTDILFSTDSGIINPNRDRAFMGRERHDMGRENDAGYPVRCLRTAQYLYIRNYEPERWPAGNPETGFTNCGNSPTKEHIIKLNEQGDSRSYELCFGKRPAEELFDIKTDPYCMNNLAEKPELTELKKSLHDELEEKLRETNDPRMFGNGEIFDKYEYCNNEPHSWRNYLAGSWHSKGY
ncbi:MAG: sulfatase [Victivallaceae bacterium]|nr:sulfatase [Victivallaceae bacterium]